MGAAMRYQPQGRFQIDRSNPLGAKVIECLPFNGQMSTAVSRAPIALGSGGKNALSPRGYCLRGSGAGGRASVPLDLSKYSKISIAFWLYWDAYANNDSLLMELGTAYGVNNGLLIDPNCSSPASFMFGSGDTSHNNLVTFPRPSAGVWHRILLTMDRGAVAGASGTAYVDGIPQTITAFPGASAATGNFGSDTLHLFSRNEASLLGTGNLEALTFYAGVLSAAEVAQDYQNCYQIFSAGSNSSTYQAAIASVSAPTGGASVSAQGVSSSAIVGSASASGSASAAPSGVSGSALTGTATASAGTSANAAPNGVSATAAVGSPAAQGGASATATGVQANTAIGSPTAAGAATATPSGISATAVTGTASANGSAAVAAAGIAASAAVGAAQGSGSAAAAPAGVSASASVGTATASSTGFGTAAPAGVSASARVGAASGSGTANAAPGGVVATMTVGQVIAAGTIVINANAQPLGVTAFGRTGIATASAPAGGSTVDAVNVSPSHTVVFEGMKRITNFEGGKHVVTFEGCGTRDACRTVRF